ncbi:MAG: hypothetical protein GY796_02910, partial [Chloroflexi bacterium]|nr:hypothetical protein [Chloroflexota bacterium]
MPKQDFLMRMLEQLINGLLPYILDLTRSGHYEEAHAVIDQAVRELIGVGVDSAVKLSDDVLLDRLKTGKAIAWEEKALFLVTIFAEDGEILIKEQEEEAAYGRFVKALNLILLTALHGVEIEPPGDLIPDVDKLQNRLVDYLLPGLTSAYLIAYYEQLGDFAAAEDILFDWLEAEPEIAQSGDPNPVEVGLAFYGRLQQKPDEELAA